MRAIRRNLPNVESGPNAGALIAFSESQSKSQEKSAQRATGQILCQAMNKFSFEHLSTWTVN